MQDMHVDLRGQGGAEVSLYRVAGLLLARERLSIWQNDQGDEAVVSS